MFSSCPGLHSDSASDLHFRDWLLYLSFLTLRHWSILRRVWLLYWLFLALHLDSDTDLYSGEADYCTDCFLPYTQIQTLIYTQARLTIVLIVSCLTLRFRHWSILRRVWLLYWLFLALHSDSDTDLYSGVSDYCTDCSLPYTQIQTLIYTQARLTIVLIVSCLTLRFRHWSILRRGWLLYCLFLALHSDSDTDLYSGEADYCTDCFLPYTQIQTLNYTQACLTIVLIVSCLTLRFRHWSILRRGWLLYWLFLALHSDSDTDLYSGEADYCTDCFLPYTQIQTLIYSQASLTIILIVSCLTLRFRHWSILRRGWLLYWLFLALHSDSDTDLYSGEADYCTACFLPYTQIQTLIYTQARLTIVLIVSCLTLRFRHWSILRRVWLLYWLFLALHSDSDTDLYSGEADYCTDCFLPYTQIQTLIYTQARLTIVLIVSCLTLRFRHWSILRRGWLLYWLFLALHSDSDTDLYSGEADYCTDCFLPYTQIQTLIYTQARLTIVLIVSCLTLRFRHWSILFRGWLLFSSFLVLHSDSATDLFSGEADYCPDRFLFYTLIQPLIYNLARLIIVLIVSRLTLRFSHWSLTWRGWLLYLSFFTLRFSHWSIPLRGWLLYWSILVLHSNSATGQYTGETDYYTHRSLSYTHIQLLIYTLSRLTIVLIVSCLTLRFIHWSIVSRNWLLSSLCPVLHSNSVTDLSDWISWGREYTGCISAEV